MNTIKVLLLTEYKGHYAGDRMDLPSIEAQELLRSGAAVLANQPRVKILQKPQAIKAVK